MICIFGPPLLGSSPLVAAVSIELGGRVLPMLAFSFAFAFALLPSLFYFFIMEAWFARRKIPSYLATVILSSVMGAVAGIVIGWAAGNYSGGAFVLGLIGFFVGIVLGIFLEFVTNRDQTLKFRSSGASNETILLSKPGVQGGGLGVTAYGVLLLALFLRGLGDEGSIVLREGCPSCFRWIVWPVQAMD